MAKTTTKQTKARAKNILKNVKKEKIKAWSYSRLSTYLRCPRAAFLEYIQKIPRPDSAAMNRGSRIHSLCEEYMRARPGQKVPRRKNLPDELANFEDEFLELRKLRNFRVEEQWAFRKDWTPTDWFGEDAWCRMKVDFVHVDMAKDHIHVIDYKTGKVRKANEEQLELYAIGAMFMYEPKTVQCDLWYLDSGEMIEVEYDAKEITEKLMKKWNKKAQGILNDTSFVPRPHPNACRYCSFSKTKEGVCDVG